ncbi:MAG: response regulator [bacterium]|nr:response regulator [bacterium]
MSEKENTPLKKPLILLVDDVPKNLQVLGNILKKKDCIISIATNGKQALEKVDALLPDLVLLDVMMPEMDGFEVCLAMKSEPRTKDIPVIFLTARNEIEDVITGFRLGAADYVTKPFNKAELLARVKTQLTLRRTILENIRLEQENAVLAMAETANHEINQPMTVLQGNFELFKSTIDLDGLSEKQTGYITKIRDSITRIHAIFKKYMGAGSIRFESQTGTPGTPKMVVFEKDED